MKKAVIILLVLSSAMGVYWEANAQKVGDERIRITFTGGLNEYDGDLGEELFKLDSNSPAFRFGAKYGLSPYFDIDWGASFGGLDFMNFDQLVMDTDLNLQAIPFTTDSRFSPVVTAGIGLYGHDGFGPELMAPVGAGFRLKLVDGLDLTYTGSYKIGLSGDSFSYLQHMAGFAFNLAGGEPSTSKGDKDSDLDGILDSTEIEAERKKDAVDTDGDGTPNYLDTDSDNDGISDKTEAGSNPLIPVDTDGDGVANYKDLDSDADGMNDAIEVGMNPDQPVDSDSDGSADYTDADSDNDTIKDKIEAVDASSPVDTDGDSTPDYLDTDSDNDGIDDSQEVGDDINSPLDTNQDGNPDYRDGDADGDGVGDGIDLCRLAAGTAAAKGCPDQDNDGVQDTDDLCPDVAGVIENKGCPIIKEEVKEILAKALEGINFQSGKDIILTSSYPILDQVASVMKEEPVYKLEIAGHTDNTGNADNNLDLSKRRAQAAKNYLIEHGVAAERIVKADGFGITQPIADNNTRAGRSKNRRVEFKIVF